MKQILALELKIKMYDSNIRQIEKDISVLQIIKNNCESIILELVECEGSLLNISNEVCGLLINKIAIFCGPTKDIIENNVVPNVDKVNKLISNISVLINSLHKEKRDCESLLKNANRELIIYKNRGVHNGNAI